MANSNVRPTASFDHLVDAEQERLRDRQPERLGGRCLPGGLCCNLTFPSLAAVRRGRTNGVHLAACQRENRNVSAAHRGRLIPLPRSSRCWIAQFTCCQTRRQLAASLRLVERCRKKRREFTIIQPLERVG